METCTKKGIILSFSFGNYLKADGGVDKVIAQHNDIFVTSGYCYLEIAPVLPENIIGKLIDTLKIRLYTIVNDGKYIGVFSEYEVSRYINSIIDMYSIGIAAVHIHHMKKFAVDYLIGVVNQYNVPISFFVHDYYSICEHPNLLKNGVTFCQCNEKSSAVCRGCEFSNYVDSHIGNTRRLLRKCKDLQICFPSEVTRDIWCATFTEYKDSSKCKIIPHQKKVGLSEKCIEINDPLRIAFVGRFDVNKGSEAWKKVEKTVTQGKLNYDLYYLGFSMSSDITSKRIEVRVTPTNPDAMINALTENRIDCVFEWSVCPETYSYAYFEAWLANKFVITNKDSGNIAAQVLCNKNGEVYSNIDEFVTDLQNEELFAQKVADRMCEATAGPIKYEPNTEIISSTLENPKAMIDKAWGKKCLAIAKLPLKWMYERNNKSAWRDLK